MSSSLLIAKLFAGTASLGGVAAAVSMGVVWSQQTSTPHAKVIVVKATTSSNTTSTITTLDQKQKNYKCRLTSATSSSGSDCKLVKLDTSVKWVDITKITDAKSQPPLEVSALKVATNYFKLEVEDSLYKTVDLSSASITVDIIDAADSHLPIATLTPLFKLDGTTPDFKHATHLLGKATAAAAAIKATDGSNKSKCSVEATPTGTETECIAIAFGDTAVETNANSTKYSTQTFTHTTTALEALVQNKYYLLKYTTPETKLLPDAIKTPTAAYVAKHDDTAWTNKGTLSEVVPVIIDGADANSVAFILSTHTATSSQAN